MNAFSDEADSDALQLGRLIEKAMDNRRAGLPVDVEALLGENSRYREQLAELLPVLEVLADLSEVSSRSTGDDNARPHGDTARGDSPTISIVGDYRIIRELGRGGMGVVYEATQIGPGRRVALKILPFASLLDEIQLARFNTEATAAARLQHSGIVQVYSVGCERGIHFYAMQLVDGPSLAEVIAEMRREKAPIDAEEAAETVVVRRVDVLTRDEDGGHYRAVARIGKEAAEALQYAHDNGVLHRDIKPGNLLLDAVGHVWIADFGLARVEDESQLTRTGDILGTLRYMSPEQATGEHGKIDARADVYGLGATLYELATLQPAFESHDRRDIIKQITTGNPRAPHEVDARIPQPLSHVISKAMAQLDERYQCAQELADDLQRFLDGSTVTATPPTPLRRATAWSRRNRLASAAIIGLLLLVLALPFTTHHFFQRAPDGSPTKGPDMNVSKKARVAVAAAAIAMATAGVNAKKPTTPPPPEPGPVPIEYQLTWIDAGDPSIRSFGAYDFNSAGVVVGRASYLDGHRQAFRWSKSSGFQLLDDLSASWVDLADSSSPAPGWTTVTATGINEAGQIAGYASKEGEYSRMFLYTDSTGFSLLPSPPGAGDCGSGSISEQGDIIGQAYLGDSFYPFGVFWTRLNPTKVTAFLDGYWFFGASQRMSNLFFTANNQDTQQDEVFAYLVDNDGTFSFQQVHVFDDGELSGSMSDNHLIPFKEKVTEKVRGRMVTSYYASVYDALDGSVSRLAEAEATIHPPGCVNTSGDVIFQGVDGLAMLYRALENMSYKIYDLLDDAAKAELYIDASTPKYEREFGTAGSYINNSDVAGVPVEDPFDHILGRVNYYDEDGVFMTRMLLLTPVKLP